MPKETREAVGVEAVEAVVKRREREFWTDPPSGEDLEVVRQDFREDLQAALPHLQKQFRDQLLSDESVEAVASERWMQERVSVRTEQGADLLPWQLLTEETREQKIHQARQLLEAALKATPTATEEAGS